MHSIGTLLSLTALLYASAAMADEAAPAVDAVPPAAAAIVPASEPPPAAEAAQAASGPDAAAASAQAVEATPAVPAATLVKLEAFPGDVHLSTKLDRQSLVVQATYSDGLTRDVTTEAQISVTGGEFARVDGQTLHPQADGRGEVQVSYGGQTVKLPLVVQDATADRPISFKLDVMPVLAKGGCNTGSCHGAARGKDGFQLSLFGFDPDGDYHRITREINGRRINLAVPANSLFVEKALGKVQHTGGTRFTEDSELNQTLLRWLEAGAPKDPGPVPELVGLEVYPTSAVLDGKDAPQRLTVRAKYADGTDRDVTALAFFMSNNDTSAKISPEGVVTAGERGEAFIMARYGTMTVGSHFIVLPKGLQFTFPELPEHNYIDQFVHNKLKKLRIAPSELCTDEEFLRRVYIDIVGVLPTPEEYHKFIGRPEPNKREILVDELLGRKEFVELWVMKWAELLKVRSSPEVSPKAILLYYNWLQEKIATNVPMDQMVRELLAASGGTFTNGATNYYEVERDTLKTAENTAQVFMGMRIQCAQCHNHPFDRWTMDDYYSFASFFTQIGRKPAEDPRERIVFNAGGGEFNHPVAGRPLPPKFLGGAVPDVAGKDRREVLADWLASPENPYFATNLANIVWAHFFGRGIIHEVDDVRISNPAVNPELLAELGKRFTEYNYDFKKIVRDICTSRTYQLATRTNESNATDDRNFSHAAIRRIRAEVLLDALTQITDTKNKFPGLPLGARAVQVADGNTSNYFLTTFGRSTRESVCSCEVKMEPSLSQALHLLNGDTVHQRIQEGKVIEKHLAAGKQAPEIIEDLYIRCVSRKPTEQELATITANVAAAPDLKNALEDVFWALGNSREFLFNH